VGAAVERGRTLGELYDQALPEVYGYLKPRCGDFALAEDLTAETFLAACDAVDRQQVGDVTVAVSIGIRIGVQTEYPTRYNVRNNDDPSWRGRDEFRCYFK
jgi:Sigma-70 region 2